MAAVTADPDSAAHREAMQKRDVRLWIFGNFRVQAVFIAPETAAIFEIPVAPGIVEFLNVAAGAECLVAGTVDDDQRHGIVIGPGVERLFYGEAHVMAKRIESLGAGQGDPARAAFDADVDVVAHCSASS